MKKCEEPRMTKTAYKLFRIKNGKLYPPMVPNKNNEATPMSTWIEAEPGEFAGYSKTGRPRVKSEGTGTPAFRPGWHLSEIPRAPQFDRKGIRGPVFPKDFIWAECEYASEIDYQEEADAKGYQRTYITEDGSIKIALSSSFQYSLAGLDHVPVNGCYRYRTNPRADTPVWIISGAIIIKRLLSDEEVNEILIGKDIAPINRRGGNKTLKELGVE